MCQCVPNQPPYLTLPCYGTIIAVNHVYLLDGLVLAVEAKASISWIRQQQQ